MDWQTILTAIIGLFSAGGVVYLLVDKKVPSTTEKVENAEKAIPLYHDIREIVKEEVEPLKHELDYLKTHYCCYRDQCEMRILMKPQNDED